MRTEHQACAGSLDGTIRRSFSLSWLMAAALSLACSAPPTAGTPPPAPAEPTTDTKVRTETSQEPIANAAGDRARSLLADKLTGGAPSAVVEGLSRGEFLVSYEELHSELIDHLLPGVDIFVATLQRRVPDSVVIAVGADGSVLGLPSDFSALLQAADLDLGDSETLADVARLYVSLASPSRVVVFPERWEEIPGVVEAPTLKAGSEVHEMRVEESPTGWQLSLTSWEKSFGRVVSWKLHVNKTDRTVEVQRDEIAQRVGDFVVDAYY